MSKRIMIAAIAVGTLTLYSYAKLIFSEAALMERFPEVPQRDIIKAHRRMVHAALQGELKDVNTDDDVAMEEVFIKHLRAVQNR